MNEADIRQLLFTLFKEYSFDMPDNDSKFLSRNI